MTIFFSRHQTYHGHAQGVHVLSTFVGVMGGCLCFLSTSSNQGISLDEQRKLVVFKDHWDENALTRQLHDCYAGVEGESSNTKKEYSSKNPSKHSKKEDNSNKYYKKQREEE